MSIWWFAYLGLPLYVALSWLLGWHSGVVFGLGYAIAIPITYFVVFRLGARVLRWFGIAIVEPITANSITIQCAFGLLFGLMAVLLAIVVRQVLGL